MIAEFHNLPLALRIALASLSFGVVMIGLAMWLAG